MMAMPGACAWHPELVLLTSIDGASVELRISGHQFPGYEGTTRRDWDANWLKVCGNVAQADGKTWSFEDPSLTTWEAQALGTWLQRAAAGTVAVSPRHRTRRAVRYDGIAFL
jgi:hypothetical protein